jgi:hypothetical protein
MCTFLCSDGKYGPMFTNVLEIDGVDANTVQLNGELVP